MNAGISIISCIITNDTKSAESQALLSAQAIANGNEKEKIIKKKLAI